MQAISRIASRGIGETLELIDQVVDNLSAKVMKLQEKRDTLSRVDYWIHIYQQKIVDLDERIHHARAHGAISPLERLNQDKAELERKLAWRYQQQHNLRTTLQKADARPSYKDIAALLNVPPGTVGSRVTRAREELAQRLDRVRDAL